MMKSLALLSAIGSAVAGTVLWDGRFNDMTSSAALSSWSWSDQTGPYQYYIHGSEAVADYVNLASDFKNPADTSSTQGVKITLDSTSYWNGQTMRRTELIPQTSAAINAGKVYYHFSMSRSGTNAPSEAREHQIAFFESHFTEMKSGWQSGATGTTDPLLRWNAASTTQWNTTWEAGVWHNVAYGIDFDAKTVEFYHSTGADDLVLTVPAVSAAASSSGSDWHLGMLELPRDGYTDTDEDIYFSGVYVESGDITLTVSGPGGSASASASGSVTAPSTVAASTIAAISSSMATATISSATVESSSSAAVLSTATAEPIAVSTSSAPATIAVETSSSVAAVVTTSAPVAASSAVPTTLQTIVKPSSTSSASPAATSAADEDDDDVCE